MKTEDYIFTKDGKMYVLPKKDITFNTSITTDDNPLIEGNFVYVPILIEGNQFIEVDYHHDNQITVNGVGYYNINYTQYIINQYYDFRIVDDFRELEELIPEALISVSDYMQQQRQEQIEQIIR